MAAELRAAFLATDDRLVAEEGSTATAVLAWRDAEGAVCLQVRPGTVRAVRLRAVGAYLSVV